MAWLAGLLPVRSWIKIGAVVAVVAALLWALLAWGGSRYRDGVRDTDAKWAQAGERLEKQAGKAATRADRAEAARVEDHNERLAAEKEKIDEAVAEGRSPFDALFPPDSGVRDDAGGRAAQTRR